jgi:Tfp pilus assembly protein PilX
MMNANQMTDEQKRRQRGKNIAVMLALLALVALLYVITLVRIGGNA